MKGYAERSLAIAEELEDEQGSIWPLIFLGLWAGETGDYERAEELYAEAISAATSVGDRKLIGIATNNLGNVAMQRREFTRAIALFQRALQISREIGTHDETAVVTLNIAECLLHLERFDEATHAAREGLLLARQVGSSYAMEYGFFLFAALAWRRGDEDTHTVRLLGITEALRDELGGVNEDKAELELLAAMTGDLVASLGDTGYATALAEGRAMGLDKAVDFVLASLD
jgi:tetratricopeptide (TPR) repeat protein